MVNRKFGVDIGGVLIGRENDGTDTSFFGPNYLLTTQVPQAFESIKKLREADFDVYLVSKCGASTEKKTLDWLEHNNFYDLTNVDRNRVRFCRQRAEKAGICDEIGVTHFIDDRLEVLSYLVNVEHLFLINADAKEVRRYQHFLPKVNMVRTWPEVLDLALAALVS